MTKSITKNWKILLLVIIVVIGAILRFNKISELHFFTYDQARDDLIVKRILVDNKWTLLGPQSSIGGVYSPPFYYYTIAVPLWLFGLNPIGVDIYTAFIGVLTVLLIFYVANDLFGEFAGLFASASYAVSPIMVELSRHAWNPNTLPFFSLLSLFLAYKFWKQKEVKTLVAMSFVFGYTLSLHYSVFCLLPVIIYLWYDFFRTKRQFRPIFVSFLILFLFFLPLLIFDLRHGFILSNNLINYFLKRGPYYFNKNMPSFFEATFVSAYEIIVATLSGYFLKGVGGSLVPYDFVGRARDVLFQFAPVSIIAHKPLIIKYYYWGQLVFIVIIIFSIFRMFYGKQKDKNLTFLWFWFLSGIVASRLYRGTIYFFYYLFLYPVSFLFLGALLKWISEKSKWLKFSVLLILLVMITINIKDNLTYEVSKRTIVDIRAVAKIISKDVGDESFNIAASYGDPDRWDHHALDYRYFIETFYKKRPLDWYPENYRQSQILYFVSEGKIPNPLESKIMEVEEFKPKKLMKTWSYHNEIFVYKLAK